MRKLARHELAVASMQHALAFQKRKSVQWKGQTVGLLLVRQRLLKMQAKSFHPAPCSIDAASVQILSNAALMLIAVYDVTVSSHLSALNFYFYSIKIMLATGRLINIDKLTFD